MITIALADDQVGIRDAMASILNDAPDIDVVAAVGDGRSLVRAIDELRPTATLVDVRMPTMDGLDALDELARRRLIGGSATRAIVLTTFDVDDYAERALRSGASGFLLKTVPHEQLVDAVRTVANGDALLAPSTTQRFINRYLATPPLRFPTREQTRALERLTARERELLAVLATGASNLEIAEELYISEHTVKTHVASILSKTGCRDRTQAVVLAFELGIAPRGSGDLT
jgi:DNA-binding NarL/FixJ family response regulator